MDFNQLDIRRFLIGALPSHFSHVTPADFESFINYLFHVDGYEVERISKKSDQSANLLAKKDDITLVIRVLRYLPSQLIGESDVQKAISAREFYETDQSWIITTSGFSSEAKSMAEAAEIELWDWEALEQALHETFFEGKSYIEFISPLPPFNNPPDTTGPLLKIIAKWEAQEGVEGKWYNLLLTLSNPGEENIYIHLDLPVLIDKDKNQLSAEKWGEEEFVAGMIYAGASVRTNALFKKSKLGERPPGGKIVLTCHEREPQRSYHLSTKLKGEACYFVTYCYSRQSEEYMLMTKYRDEILSSSLIGRLCIALYYWISPTFVEFAPGIKIIDKGVRKLSRIAIQYVRSYYFKKENKTT